MYPTPCSDSFFIFRDDPEIKSIVKYANTIIEEKKISLFNAQDTLVMAETQKLIHLFYKIFKGQNIRNHLFKCLEENMFINHPHNQIYPSVPDSYTHLT